MVFLIWYNAWVTKIEKNEMGYAFNKRNGQIEKFDRSGWIVRTPWWYDVYAIDLRPSQVCMNANNRVLNCKLVKFNPDGFSTFIEWHGPGAGQGEWIYEILKSYAFNVNEGRDCPFLTITDDMRRKSSQPATLPAEASR
ncbi:hypothetical protein KW807_01815 [Candidatus Parcubacteria bacterium]|nr:hypothetical protein [Candidatus Parcubacteria bacterium]